MTSLLFLNVPLILVSVVGILFNGYIVTAVLLTRQVTTANNILLLHLGTIDLILGILFLIFSAPNNYTKTVWLSDDGGFGCIFHGFLHNLLHPLALWTLCGLNCDRYYAIAAPLHYSHIINAKKVLVGLGFGWVVALVLALPPFFGVAPYGFSHSFGACAPDFTGYGTLWYSSVYTTFTLLLPTVLIICCNLKILMIARYQRHRIASAIYEVTLSAQVTITHQRNPFFVPTVTAPSNGGPKFHGSSAIYSILQLVGSIALLYFPYYTIIIWESITSTFFHHIETKSFPGHLTYKIAAILILLSPTINAFFYGVKNKPLRKGFKNYWRKKQTKSEVNQEIQARTPSTCGSRRPSLTPAGFLSKPTLQRRLSDAFFDCKAASSSPQRHKIRRITTDTWRPSSASSLALNNNEDARTRLKQTTSCNALQPPDAERTQVTRSPTMPKLATIYKMFGEGKQRQSPRITITRAFSIESPAPKPLLETSDSSEDMSDKIFMALDAKTHHEEGDNEERKLLLTWPRLEQVHIYGENGDDEQNIDALRLHELARANLIKQKTVQSQNI